MPLKDVVTGAPRCSARRTSVALAFAFAFLLIGLYPGANLFVAALIAAVLGLPGAFLYAMLAGTPSPIRVSTSSVSVRKSTGPLS